MYAQDSIDMLTQAGIRFKRHEEEGINAHHFAELIISSGLVLCEDITWITFGRYHQHFIIILVSTVVE